MIIKLASCGIPQFHTYMPFLYKILIVDEKYQELSGYLLTVWRYLMILMIISSAVY